MEDAKIGQPIQTSTITCVKALNHCFAANAILYDAKLLTSDLELLEIERWDQHEIVTKPTDATCARTTTRLSRDQQVVTGVWSTFNTPKCASLGFAPGDKHLRMVDGTDVALQIRGQSR